jgi:hypothetical protein
MQAGDITRQRPFRAFLTLVTVVAAFFALALPAVAAVQSDPETSETSETSEIDELRRQIEQLRQEMVDMRQVDESSPAEDPDRVDELERRLDILAGELERLSLGEAAVVADEGQYGYGPAASKIYRTQQGLSVGGYGEMLYERFDDTRDDGSAGATDQLDFLRAILYFGYKFNDRWLLNTEIELEHTDEASVEFAYLDYLHSPALNARAGLLLVPMGFVNELHEPTTFLGATRPDVERVIIPTTWRENGFGLFGEVGQVSYRTYIVNGLEGANFSAGGLRGGRQKGGKARAEDFAWVGRLDFEPMPGLLLGASAYVGDSGQDLETADGRPVGLGTQIIEGHAEWRFRGLELRGLYTQAELDDVALANEALGLFGPTSLGESLSGYYLQAGYDILSAFGRDEQELTPYVRYEAYNTQDDVPAGFAADPITDVESLTLGLAWRPIDQIILKVDFQDYDNAAGSGQDRFNVALGYIF